MKIFEIFNQYRELLQTPLGVFEFFALIIIILSVLAIFVSVLVNFIECDKRRKVMREKKSIVETGTMTLFFVVYYVIIKMRVGTIHLDWKLHLIFIVIGLILIVVGSFVNIRGRFSLGRNWANQIKIYNDHTLVQSGVYKIVRHPLYASLIWMFFGGSLVYMNYLAFALNSFIFIPFMYYRAKQEEIALSSRFKEYYNYKDKVGMFFPKL